VTALAPLVVVAGSSIGAAGIDHAAVGALLGSFPASGGVGATPVLSVLGLGVQPILAAYLLVELAALVVPRWRTLRHAGIEGRATLERAAVLLTLLLATIQALGIARAAEAAQLFAGSGIAPPLLLSLSLVAGVSLLVLVARVIQLHGLGNGMAVVTVSALLYGELGSLRNQAAQLAAGVGPLDVAIAVVVALALAGVTLLALGVRLRGRGDATVPEPHDDANTDYRSAARRTGHVDAPLPVPASGALPFSALAILAAPPALLSAWFALIGPTPLHSLEPTVAIPTEVAFTTALVVGLSILFNRPSRVAAVRAAVAPRYADTSAAARETTARRDLRDAVVGTLAFVGSVTAIRLGASAYGALVPAVLPVVLATALVADLGAEWRARRRRGDLVLVWPEHRPHAVAPATAALAAADIDVHARGLFHRTMLQALGPWAPIELFVARADAEKAREILEVSLAGRAPRPSADAEKPTRRRRPERPEDVAREDGSS
jgi:preprotein translocase subunit SecY